MSPETREPLAGEVWQDKDKRVSVRSVRVHSRGGGFVYYYRGREPTGRLFRSRRDRFVKAFLPPKDDGYRGV